MLLLPPLMFVVIEGFPSLLVDEKDTKESVRGTAAHENSSDKSSADLLSDLLLDLKEEMEMKTASASIKVHNFMTKEGQSGNNTSDLQKSTNSPNHSTTIAPRGKKNKKLQGAKEMGATNIDSGHTDKGFEGPQKTLPEDIGQLSQEDESSTGDAENENCKPERWCHTTFSNEYQTRKEEECKETFVR